jgi:hypothetical protein
MPLALQARLNSMLPRFGDRSKLVRALIEAWLNGTVTVPVQLKSRSVALRNAVSTGASNARLDARGAILTSDGWE